MGAMQQTDRETGRRTDNRTHPSLHADKILTHSIRDDDELKTSASRVLRYSKRCVLRHIQLCTTVTRDHISATGRNSIVIRLEQKNSPVK